MPPGFISVLLTMALRGVPAEHDGQRRDDREQPQCRSQHPSYRIDIPPPHILFVAMPPGFISVLLTMALRGVGDSITPLKFMALGDSATQPRAAARPDPWHKDR
jgi:hypothetical protein